MRSISPILLVCLLALGWQCNYTNPSLAAEPVSSPVFSSQQHEFQLTLVAGRMRVPWSMDWLPDGRALITDRRAGQLYLVQPDDTTRTAICNLPEVYTHQDSGMREILAHPDYSNSGWIYLSYDRSRPDSSSTLIVERARLQDNCLTEREQLFEALPWYKSGYHYGGRMVLDQGYLFVSVGDRHMRDSAQLLRTHNGKIIRLHEDGQIPADNPFVNQAGAMPEIWSYGHRNPQGLTRHPLTGELWEHEHGPQGGDEINIIRRGANYGWPIITYGEEYGGGPIGEGITRQIGMEQPVWYYVPCIAPSGMDFYTGTDFPDWKSSLFIGTMRQRALQRLTIVEDRVIGEERLLEAKGWRIRFVRQGPDGLLYFGTDEGDVWRIEPVVG